VLAGARLARLACARDNQPYIVPVYIAYDRPPDGEPRLYGFTTAGQKVEWMRANPLVCVEVDDVASHDEWTSVIVLGRYEELPDTLGHDGDWLREHERSQMGLDEEHGAPGPLDERLLAYKVLQAQAVWWEPGSIAHVDPAQAGRLAPIYYRVSIDQITGHRATPDAPTAAPPAAPAPEESWVRRLLRFVR
jgi:nitroimidazol reductase NimA-like FMN-containing flavoprotein (pyridoxamine 5'-phosphate oxidase superfamily)